MLLLLMVSNCMGTLLATVDDPQDAEVARMYKTDMNLFNFTAKQWTTNYAQKTLESQKDEKVQNMMAMGFDEQQCKDALARYGGDANMAINYLLGA